LLLLAQEVAALLSCAAYLAISNEEERIHVMSLTGLAQRLSDELANSLDISTFSFQLKEASHDQQCEV
jgi:hypothetical protein